MIFFATAMSSFYLGTAVPCVQFIESGRVAAARVDRTIKKCKKFDGNKRIIRLKGSVSFDSVYFNYPSNPSVNILQGINFNVQPGDSLALVGETGSGKSTIIQLIEGFYYCSSGTVRIDGLKSETTTCQLSENSLLWSTRSLFFSNEHQGKY